jgi:hypothetical protein
VNPGTFLRQPALHLLLLGGLLFAADRVRTPPPPPWPVVVDLATQARLRADWQRDTGRQPQPAEWNALLRAHADEEILVREALARDYARRDPVVRQRLIDNLRFLQPEDPRRDEALLREALALGMAERDWVARRRLVWRLQTALAAETLAGSRLPFALPDLDPPAAPPLLRFEQRYFREAPAAQAALAALQADRPAGEITGEPFLLGSAPPPLTAEALADRWGAAFAAAVADAPVGIWTGPVASAWGWHVLRVIAQLPAAADPRGDRPSHERRLQQVQAQAVEHRLAAWRPAHPLQVEGGP